MGTFGTFDFSFITKTFFPFIGTGWGVTFFISVLVLPKFGVNRLATTKEVKEQTNFFFGGDGCFCCNGSSQQWRLLWLRCAVFVSFNLRDYPCSFLIQLFKTIFERAKIGIFDYLFFPASFLPFAVSLYFCRRLIGIEKYRCFVRVRG